MKASIFQYLDYKDVLWGFIEEHATVYGYKAQMAEAAGCQRSYFSQVLHADRDLTVEQAYGLAVFWNLGALEKEYFLNLVHFARASTTALRDYYTQQLELLKRKQVDLSKRYRQTDLSTSNEIQSRYYSSWHFAAVHMATTVPALQRPAQIAEYLKVEEIPVREALMFLKSAGLVDEKENDVYECKVSSVHLPRDSHMNQVNHSTWRQKALTALLASGPNDVHYSAVYSISRKDLTALRDLILKSIDQTRQLVEPSEEEELVGLTCDLFALGSGKVGGS